MEVSWPEVATSISLLGVKPARPTKHVLSIITDLCFRVSCQEVLISLGKDRECVTVWFFPSQASGCQRHLSYSALLRSDPLLATSLQHTNTLSKEG